MRLPPYPKYKPSGVEWLGDMPEHWDVKPLKRELFRSASGGGLIKGEMASEPGDGLFQGFSASGPDVWVDEAHYTGPGVVLSAVGARCGKAFKADGQWAAVANTHVFFPAAGRSRDYLWYVLNNEEFWEKGGTAQPYIRVPATLNRPFVFAPVLEQQAIADFLDRETAKIDTLVAKKRRLIERLKEKRTALISRMVTRGLPPDAARAAGIDPHPKLKPSGIHWLDDVPEHWVTWKVTHGFRTIGSGTTPRSDDADYYEGDIPWVTTSELRESVIVDTAKKVTVAAIHEYPTLRLYAIGTLLFAMYGATIGRLGILGIPATVNQACAAFADPVQLDTWFVYYWLQMRRPTLIVLSAGGGQPNLSQDDLRQLRIPAPPLEEQRTIAAYLDDETAKTSHMVSKVDAAIERLQEYRTALITAAVTGKIDVRGAVA